MLNTYLPADRKHALARGETLPDRQTGSALFADIGGFTPLAEAMERALGAQRGAEALTACVNRIFDTLVDAVARHHGSIVGFAGDAMTCWFDADDGRLAIACALAMQSGMATSGQIAVPGVDVKSVGLKVTITSGETRRFQVGDPQGQLLDALAGRVIDRLAAGEKLSRGWDILVDAVLADQLAPALVIDGRHDGFVRVTGLTTPVAERPWAPLDDAQFAPDELRAWILPAVYERYRTGQSRFLAEFRPVATLFASFGGIDYDAPAAGQRLDEFMRRVMEIVTRHGGSVFDVSIGDKGSYVLAVFGAPVTYGDDVRRAVAAADELRRGEAMRIGVNAGRVYAGLYAGRARSVYRVAGDAVNLAARLMTAAQPGQVLMSGSVGAALDRRFSIRALDPILVKGRSTPVAVCELVGPADSSVRLSEPRYPLPLVGREAELAAIDDALDGASAGRGGVLAFCADAGLGKSRLVNETLQRATAGGFTCFAGECQPHGAGIAYLPWQPIWNGLFGVPQDAPPAARRDALAAILAAAAPQAAPLAPLLDRVLDLPMEDNDATRGMPAPVRKQVLEQVLAGSLRGRASMGPLCIVVEDVHWIDSLSRDLLTVLAGAIRDVPVLLVLAYRPPDNERPIVLPDMREIALGELNGAEAARLVELLVAHVTEHAPEPGVVDLITDRAQGNPFYIEELVRYVAERGGQTSDLPTSLESLILSRIDRLSKTQQLTVKVASVIGRRFPVEWLTGAYGGTVDVTTAPADLEQIRVIGLIVNDTPPPQQAFLFRHAVVRDVAYETLGFALRQSLHEQLASHLERSAGETPPVDLLAYHYARSANSEKEAEYRRLAAELAIRNGAYADALAHVTRATEIVSAQPDGSLRLEQELELQLLLGTILLVVDGQGSAKAKAVYDRARALSRAVPPGPAAGRAIFGLWTYYLFQGLMGPTEELADEAVALAEMSPDPGLRIMAHLAVCQTHMWTGKWQKTVDHYERVMELYDPAQHQAYVTQYAQNPRYTASNSGFWGSWALGYSDRALAIANDSIAEAAGLNHEFTYVIAFLCRPMLGYLQRRYDVLSANTSEYLERARRVGNPFYISLALALDAFVMVTQGRHDEGLAQLEAQDQTMRALGSKLVEPFVTSLLAESYLAAGRYQDGLALLDARFDIFNKEGRVGWIPDHLRLRAEMLVAGDPTTCDQALATLALASDVARAHGAKAFELRVQLSEAKLLVRLGRRDDASRRLAPVYEKFTEGFDDPDLREARTYLTGTRS